MSDKKKQGYEDGYSGYVDSGFLDAATTLMKSVKQQTYAMMHVKEGQTVLDVGCGPASDTIALSKISDLFFLMPWSLVSGQKLAL